LCPTGGLSFRSTAWGAESSTVKGVLKKARYSTAVADEGGFGPISNRMKRRSKVGLGTITQAVTRPAIDRHRARPSAASEFYDPAKKENKSLRNPQ